jgi:hypothetical protein
MTRSWFARRLGICLVLALLALLVPAGMAHAQATVMRFEPSSHSQSPQRFLNASPRTRNTPSVGLCNGSDLGGG